jgi:predicted NBD/HSP70 family sugar kinase
VSTRSEVARVTGLSRTAVTARLGALLRAGLLVEGDDAPSTGGRPPAQLWFNARAGVVLAGALGRSRTQLGLCDLEGEILAGAEFEHADGAVPDDLMPRLLDGFRDLLGGAGLEPEAVRGVGLSIPGSVDIERGMSIGSPIMRGWDGVALAPYLEALGPVTIRIDNDARVLALSETRGHLRAHRDLVVLKASTGISCGIIADGRLLRGSRGAAGELGHSKSPSAQGRQCRCGETGCLESVAGGWALVQDLAAAGHPVSHVRELVEQAARGDADARARIRESGRRVGEVLAAVVNVLNPRVVVVGGDMAPAYDTFVAGLRETLYADATEVASRNLEILPSTHGAQAGVVGCAQLVLNDVLSPASLDKALAAR